MHYIKLSQMVLNMAKVFCIKHRRGQYIVQYEPAIFSKYMVDCMAECGYDSGFAELYICSRKDPHDYAVITQWIDRHTFGGDGQNNIKPTADHPDKHIYP
jgi:hypothetical protein